MDSVVLSSSSNPHLRRLRRWVERPRQCRDDGVLLAEGIHLVEEALAADLSCLELFVDVDRTAVEVTALVETARRRGVSVRPVLSRLFPGVSTLETPPGILGVFARPAPKATSPTAAPASAHAFVAAGIQDPGNLGSMIRSAVATGIRELYLTPGTVDPYHHRALRASSGAAFHIGAHPEVDPPALVAGLRASERRLLAFVPDGDTPLGAIDPLVPSAIVFGAEGRGLPPEFASALDVRVRIPMEPQVESLAVPAAAAIVFYWLYPRALESRR